MTHHFKVNNFVAFPSSTFTMPCRHLAPKHFHPPQSNFLNPLSPWYPETTNLLSICGFAESR